VRVVEPDGRWALILPDPTDAVTRLWVEAPEEAGAVALMEEWVALVEKAATS
jgi:mannose-1-phosphate guanylyltransferase/phosphomannomutase